MHMVTKRQPPTLDAVVAKGDRRASLEALRDGLAATFVEASPGVRAQVASQLRATLAELAGLDPVVKKVSKADDLAARRKARRAATAAAASAAGKGD
jgi:hypothetical protein